MLRVPNVGVGIIVRKDSKVLLMKREHTHGSGCWSTPGGHLEFGESLEQCAQRELLEETDIHAKAIKFLAITNDLFEREDKHYLTVWMEGQYMSGDAIVNAPNEMSAVGWFEWDRLPEPLFLPLRNLLNGNCYGSAFFQPAGT